MANNNAVPDTDPPDVKKKKQNDFLNYLKSQRQKLPKTKYNDDVMAKIDGKILKLNTKNIA